MEQMEKPMSQFELFSLVIAVIAAIISIVGLIIARKAFLSAQSANNISERANKISEKGNEISEKALRITYEIAQRQGIVDLVAVWGNMKHVVNKENEIIGPNAIRAGNALHSTATAWNHDLVSKPILYAEYWPSFKELYEEIRNDARLVPGHNFALKTLISPEVENAYEEMRKYTLGNVNQTKIL